MWGYWSVSGWEQCIARSGELEADTGSSVVPLKWILSGPSSSWFIFWMLWLPWDFINIIIPEFFGEHMRIWFWGHHFKTWNPANICITMASGLLPSPSLRSPSPFPAQFFSIITTVWYAPYFILVSARDVSSLRTDNNLLYSLLYPQCL